MNNVAGWRVSLNDRRWLLAVILAVVLVAIGGLFAYRYVTLDRELTNKELARREAINTLVATVLSAKFERLTDIGIALATRVRFRELIDAGRWDDAVQILREVPERFPFVDRVFISDADGNLMADTPHLPAVVGRNFAYRDWFKGVSRNWEPHISGLYRRSAEPRRNLIAVSVPIRSGGGHIAGILVLQVRQEKYFDWVGKADPDPGIRILIVDGAWHAAFDSDTLVDAGEVEPVPDPVVQSLAPAGPGARVVRNTRDGEEMVFDYTPASHRWGVATLQPAGITFASRDLLLRHLLLNSVLIGLLATGATAIGAFILLRRRREEADRARREERERMQAEQQAFLRQVIDLDRNFIFAKDREGRFTLVNQAVAEAYGTSVEELIGKSDQDFNSNPEEVEHFREDDLEVMDNLKDKFVAEETLTDVSGSVRWMQTVKRPIIGPDGRADMVLGVGVDITERRAAEQRIRGQLEHLNLLDHITRAIGERQDLTSIFQVVVRNLEDSMPVDFGCVCLFEETANALRVSSVGVKSETLAIAMDKQASIDVDDNGLGRCMQGRLVYEPDVSQSEFPFPQRLAAGGLRSVVMAPLRSESRVFGVLVVARCEAEDFSSTECEFLRQLSEHVALAAHQAQLYGSLQQAYDDLRQTQQAAMQEERLRALGQMASGIAHDINNALSPVSLYTESMLETEHNLSEKARNYLETIQRSVDDVGQTVARMREFYRQREAQLELAPVDVNQMAQQVLKLTSARWRDMAQNSGTVIQVTTELAPGTPNIMGVESEIREALTNLVLNAVDAMPEGGALTLRTRVIGVDPALSVAVEVVDSGVGMDEETRQRCLEPFFTTKGERGTGLGLAMVFGMAQRHSCELEIDSTPGAGTTVRLVFATMTGSLADPGSSPASLRPPAPLRLLLVDDDPALIKSLRDALEIDGHVVTTTNGGEAGINEFRVALERGDTYAAVITDLGMPYVDGRRVAAAVKQVSPATPVIMLTGWGRRLVAEDDIPAHVDRVLAKPPKLRELREALAKLC